MQGLKLGCYGLYAVIIMTVGIILIESTCTQDITNILNGMSWQPKENKGLYNKNSGLPKLRNQYGNRVSIVPAYFIVQNYY